MAVLITGAAGFIGAHLSQRLINLGNKVVLVDKFSDYYSIELKKQRVSNLLKNSEVLEFNLEDSQSFTILNNKSIDSIIHLAAQPGVRLQYPKTLSYLSDNLTSFNNLYVWALMNGVERFTYASSSSVYGNALEFPFDEDRTSLNPKGSYPYSKYINELTALNFLQGSKMSSVGLRFFSVYGPWGRPDMAYFRLISSVLSGYEFILNGNQNIKRDFTFIDDVVESILRIHFSGNYSTDIFNIGGGSSRSINELIKITEEISGNKPKIKVSNNDPLDSLETLASSTKLRKKINFVPETNLEVGIQKTFEWAKSISPSANLKHWAESVQH